MPLHALAFLIGGSIQSQEETSEVREIERSHSTITGSCRGAPLKWVTIIPRNNYYPSGAWGRETSLSHAFESTHTLISFYVQLVFALCSASIVGASQFVSYPSWSCFMWNVAHYYLIRRHTLAVVVPAMRECICFTVPCTFFFFFFPPYIPAHLCPKILLQ